MSGAARTRDVRVVPPGLMEHGNEPVPGLPARLPRGEKLLWQGRPDWRLLANQAFHVRAVAVWFAALMVIQLVLGVRDGAPTAELLGTVAWYAVLGIIAVGVLALIAWGYARSTVYSITSRHLVIRSGIALPTTVTVPFGLVHSAAVKRYDQGYGDLPIEVQPGTHVSWLMLWPHVRPWCMARPQPMLRAVADIDDVVTVFTRALDVSLAREAAEAGLSEPAGRTSARGSRSQDSELPSGAGVAA